MFSKSFRLGRYPIFLLVFLVFTLISLACSRISFNPSDPWTVSDPDLPQTALARAITQTPFMPIEKPVERPVSTPSPDPPRPLPTLRSEPEEYIVRPNDTLAKIAQQYQVGLEALIQANNLVNPNFLEIGQVLSIPVPVPGEPGSGLKVIPDSELVYGPGGVGFDIAQFVNAKAGFLASYQEEVDDRLLSGVQIIERISTEYSVNPRLLLAILEYQSGWVTNANPDEETLEFPILVAESWRKGLYMQLAWAANQLNRGYYVWKINGVGAWILPKGELVPVSPTINAGTAGIQQFFASLVDRSQWDHAVSDDGFLRVYLEFFGNPFSYTFEPLIPPGIVQPVMQLPFEPGIPWAFTGGPHGGWGDGSAWAALDFAPPGDALGCVLSDEWVVAVADGVIVRADQGAVIQDLDFSGEGTSDGLEQTGWVVLYMHVENRDRVQTGEFIRAGERIGHPSCEGGVSSGTHLHLARRYNGEWIPADQNMPFVLDGWASRGSGREYDGYLQKDDQTIEAWEGYYPYNTIGR